MCRGVTDLWSPDYHPLLAHLCVSHDEMTIELHDSIASVNLTASLAPLGRDLLTLFRPKLFQSQARLLR